MQRIFWLFPLKLVISKFDITNPPFNEQIWPVPSDFVKSSFHCIELSVWCHQSAHLHFYQFFKLKNLWNQCNGKWRFFSFMEFYAIHSKKQGVNIWSSSSSSFICLLSITKINKIQRVGCKARRPQETTRLIREATSTSQYQIR